jgi:hypothetical protein
MRTSLTDDAGPQLSELKRRPNKCTKTSIGKSLLCTAITITHQFMDPQLGAAPVIITCYFEALGHIRVSFLRLDASTLTRF